MENLQRDDFVRLIEASAALIAADLHKSDLLTWMAARADPEPSAFDILGWMKEPGAKPRAAREVAPRIIPAVDESGSERPMRLSAPVELPPDGPVKPPSLWHHASRLEAARRKQFAEDLEVRLARPTRVRPPFDHLEVADLADDTCRYPHQGKTILFCGRLPKAGKPYCARHAKVCFVRAGG